MGRVYYTTAVDFAKWLKNEIEINNNDHPTKRFAYTIPDSWGMHKRKMRSKYFPINWTIENAMYELRELEKQLPIGPKSQ